MTARRRAAEVLAGGGGGGGRRCLGGPLKPTTAPPSAVAAAILAPPESSGSCRCYFSSSLRSASAGPRRQWSSSAAWTTSDPRRGGGRDCYPSPSSLRWPASTSMLRPRSLGGGGGCVSSSYVDQQRRGLFGIGRGKGGTAGAGGADAGEEGLESDATTGDDAGIGMGDDTTTLTDFPSAVLPPPNDSNPSSVDQALEKLFRDTSSDTQGDGGINSTTSTTDTGGGEWFTTTTTAVDVVDGSSAVSAAAELTTVASSASSAAWEPIWYSLSDQAIVAVQTLHDMTGLEYGWSIVGVTFILRLALFPLMVKSQQTTSRMAHLQPELTLIKSRYEALGTPSRQDQTAFSKQMKALFERYQVKPFRALLAPVVQLPLFMGMFFGLRKMPTLYHDELASGGMFWFPDLTVPDPLYILPLASASTFLLLIEMGKNDMMAQNAATGKLMVNVFRIMSLVMIPVCVNFESAMLCYWTANNALTMAQTALLKTPAVKRRFGIWDPPKPVPGLEPESLGEAAQKLIKRIQGQAVSEKQEMERHNQEVDVKKKGRSMFQATARSRRQQHGLTGKR